MSQGNEKFLVDGDEHPIFLLDCFLSAAHPVEKVEIEVIISKSLRMQFVIVLSGSNVFWQNVLTDNFLVNILALQPVICTFVLEDLLDADSIQLLDLFPMDVFLQAHKIFLMRFLSLLIFLEKPVRMFCD